MSRSEFLDAICRVALGKHSPDTFLNKAESEAHVLGRITEILEGPITTYWDTLEEKMESCNNRYASELLQHSDVYLKDIFENYGSVSKEGPVVLESTLRDIIYGSGVAEERLAYNQILEDVFLRQCRIVLPMGGGYNQQPTSTSVTPRRYSWPYCGVSHLFIFR